MKILAWWHAVERLWSIGRQRFGPESPATAQWVAQQKQLLADSRLRTLLHNVRELFPREQVLPVSCGLYSLLPKMIIFV